MSIGFDHQHYVPILRWKGGEIGAIRDMSKIDQLRITPLFELPAPKSAGDPPRDGKQKTMIEVAAEVASNWGGGYALFDLRVRDVALFPNVAHPVEEFFSAAREYGLRLIPVTGLGRNSSFQEAVRNVVATDSHGVCVRLLREELASSNLQHLIDAHLMRLRVHPREADLVVDLEIVGEPGFNLVEICASLPYLACWRTFTVAGSSFPQDLQGMEEGSNYVPRWEWRAWKNQICQALPRIPTFGDYTILHPVLSEWIPGMNPSAGIRYTTDEQWLVMRGRGIHTENSGGHQQYPALAQLLCARSEYCGQHFSAGDKYLHDVRIGRKHTGNPATWLRAGVNHHLAFVVVQLANLFDSSTGGTR
ncbi:hypothetical protein BH24GEM2_BH24GEM2_11600 [soil metagenome]